ncbi:putative helicase [Trypanosoma cruzi]|nr:putative helicase [Trypanosoma cruzi]
MLLLDDRFERGAFQKRLSKWCAASLKVHHTPASVLKELSTFYRLMTASSAAEKEQPQQEQSEEEERGGLRERTKAFQCLAPLDRVARVLSASEANRQHSNAKAPLPFSPTAMNKRPRITTCTHEWSCTAVKLLYEAHNAVEDVAAAELRDALHFLEEEYLELPAKK